jgi:two-component sensor histidine kinase
MTKKDKLKLEIYHTGNQLELAHIENTNGLGMQLVQGLSQQIDCTLNIKEGDFTKFIISFAHE